MVKAVYTFLGCLLISMGSYAAPTTLDCQSSTNNFESNLSELEKVAANVDDCPTPTESQYTKVCNSIYSKKSPSEGSELAYKYQEDLWEMSCAKTPGDSIEAANKKIQTMWKKHRETFRCYQYDGVSVPNANVAKFSMDVNFSTFLVTAVKKYNLDMNFKDPADGKTVMDFLQDQYTSYKKAGYNDKAAEYDRIYKLLEKAGAKHGKDL